MRVAILGGGHGGYAAAVDLTIRGFEVCLFTFSTERIRTLWKQDNCIAYDGVWGKGSCRISKITDSMEEAVVWADMVMLNVPGTGHEFYLDRLKCTAKLILYTEGVKVRQDIIVLCTWQ